MTTPKTPWSDAEHDFLVACSKANIPFTWVDRALGRPKRSAHSHAIATGLRESVWKGRISYDKSRQLREKFKTICEEHGVQGNG